MRESFLGFDTFIFFLLSWYEKIQSNLPRSFSFIYSKISSTNDCFFWLFLKKSFSCSSQHRTTYYYYIGLLCAYFTWITILIQWVIEQYRFFPTTLEWTFSLFISDHCSSSLCSLCVSFSYFKWNDKRRYSLILLLTFCAFFS